MCGFLKRFSLLLFEFMGLLDRRFGKIRRNRSIDSFKLQT
ncbi:hypothetical protein LBBP_00819 [Leptospira borgpetersenii serovar Ballum]|uniref:Uncharacterized protein n=1 Tax=Leptospira borgpetersenii serovar Ballum TaxID=280505 RepID=A0A0S2INH2_LEPBO|nr:hypothetical protein LBBP_00819 [Leptospira borgpetersenii serovar Ballum]